MDKSILKQFLKAGFVFKGELFPTDDGTPQGGVISPILANMALDGMEKVLQNHFDLSLKGKVSAFCHNKSKVNLVRYADDFIITAATKEIAMKAKELISNFLKTRGLELSEEKTVISHIDDGFDMLGWTFRKFKGKLIVKPSRKAIKAFVATLSETILGRGKAISQEVLIKKLNQKIRGWTNYHQSVCASKAFAYLDYILFELLWRWAKRRHPHKGKWWISTKYWHSKGNRSWVFCTDNVELLRVDHIPIVRHTRVRMDANPYLEPEYFIQRQFNHGMKRLSGRFKQVWKNQNGCCYHCGQPIDIGDGKDIFFKIPISKGGKDEVSNMAYVHNHCQLLYTERRSKEL
jgi:RNA-directed DNA polymerase